MDGELNNLNAAIRQMQEQTLEYARDLRRIFAEERARRLELELANRRLEDEARRRADLVSLLAHELRTPVTALVGYLELLADGGFGSLSTEQQTAVETVLRRANNLAGLVAELGQFAALASDATAARPGPLRALPEYVDRALDSVRSRAEERAIDLDLQLELPEPDRDGAWEVDLTLVSMVSAQLADNAVKFGKAGGHASVRLDVADQQLRLIVEDDGLGLPTAARERLFEDFSVGGDVMTRRQGGLGLGLAIVAHAVRLLGGKIVFEDCKPSGTRAVATIPLRPAQV